MTMKTTTRGLVLLTTCLAVAGCEMPGSKVSGIESRASEVAARADAAMNNVGNREALRGGGAQVSDGVFVAPVKERSNSSALLPTRVQTPNAVTIASRDPLNLGQIAERLSVITEIEHVTALGLSGDTPAEAGASVTRTLRPNYTGKLSEVLNKIAANFSVEWSFSDGKVIFRDYVTRQYQVPVIPSVANGGSSVGQASSNYTADFWGEFEESVKGILGEDVIYSISPSTGLLTVTARIDDHADIRDYVEEIANNMTQQIAFDVNVLSVSLSESDGVGLDLSAALNLINGASPEFTLGNVDRLPEANANLTIVEGDIDFNAVVTALSKQGNVSIDTRTGVTTVNNRPVPVENIDSVTYVASYTTETDEDSGNETTTPQPETEEVGFTLQLYPRIMNMNEIMVEYSLDLSELQSLETFGSGENQIQLPEISSTKFSQQSIVENGHTLILSGFERNRRNISRSAGASTGGLFGIGGSKQAVEERVATVVMIKPRILRNKRTITSGTR